MRCTSRERSRERRRFLPWPEMSFSLREVPCACYSERTLRAWYPNSSCARELKTTERYANEFSFSVARGHEPRHIHVERAEKYAKFWLEPIESAESRGFRSHELTALRRV